MNRILTAIAAAVIVTMLMLPAPASAAPVASTPAAGVRCDAVAYYASAWGNDVMGRGTTASPYRTFRHSTIAVVANASRSTGTACVSAMYRDSAGRLAFVPFYQFTYSK
jgi:hypothetical protein